MKDDLGKALIVFEELSYQLLGVQEQEFATCDEDRDSIKEEHKKRVAAFKALLEKADRAYA